MLEPWRRVGSTRLQRCRVFDVDEVRFEPPGGGAAEPFYRIDSPHWINVIPLIDDDEVLLVRQYRFGVEGFTLEIPGGMCDGDEPPASAARRELREETGYDAGRIEELGWVYPNPALQGNRCYSYLARDVVLAGPATPDPHEELELVREPLARIPQLIAERKITHSLVITAFHFLQLSD